MRPACRGQKMLKNSKYSLERQHVFSAGYSLGKKHHLLDAQKVGRERKLSPPHPSQVFVDGKAGREEQSHQQGVSVGLKSRSDAYSISEGQKSFLLTGSTRHKSKPKLSIMQGEAVRTARNPKLQSPMWSRGHYSFWGHSKWKAALANTYSGGPPAPDTYHG